MSESSDEEQVSPTKKLKRYLTLPEFIEPEQLKMQLISNNNLEQEMRKPDFLIIDVREKEEREASGFINGSINIPSTEFDIELSVANFWQRYKNVRGPKCAQKLVNFINNSSDSHQAEQRIMVVRGGFDQFCQMYGQEGNIITLGKSPYGY